MYTYPLSHASIAVATVEQSCDHPIASAILKAAHGKRLELASLNDSDVSSVVGSGIVAVTQEGVVAVGNRALMESNGVVLGND